MMKQDEESRIVEAQPAGNQPEARVSRKSVDRGAIGVILVVAGALMLAANLWNSSILGALVLPALGVLFLAWGFIQRQIGLLIPGSILTGLGLGVLAQQTLLTTATGEVRGAIVMLGLSLGFLAIMPLSTLVGAHFHWWPSIPGGILLAISLAMLAGPNGLAVLQALGAWWPVALIAVGLYLIWMMYRSRGGARDRDRRGLPS